MAQRRKECKVMLEVLKRALEVLNEVPRPQICVCGSIADATVNAHSSWFVPDSRLPRREITRIG